MEGSGQDTMDGEGKVERAVAVGHLHDAQRLRLRCDSSGANDATEALRSRLTAATVEVLAEGASDPRLIETRVMPTAA
ncbi:MAG: hypothetical protein ACHP7H_09360 [Hyphomicrobiales bacterium]